MAILVGLRFDEESTNKIANWLLECNNHRVFQCPLLRPIHADFLLIPLAHCGSDRMDEFVPRGEMNEVVEFLNPRIRWIGEHNTVVMEFTNDWIVNRIQDLKKLGFKRRKKAIARLPLSIHSCYLDPHGWKKIMPIKKVTVVEEIVVPFDTAIGRYAHLPKKTCQSQ